MITWERFSRALDSSTVPPMQRVALADPYTLGLDDRADDYLRTRHFVS
jgi:hypothetical protein